MIIDGEEYIKKSECKRPRWRASQEHLDRELAELTDGLQYVICRTYSAGVHIGYLKSKEGQTVELVNSRRLWSWKGANELNQVAMEGVNNESNFAMAVPEITIMQVVEIIPVSAQAKEILEGLPEWKK